MNYLKLQHNLLKDAFSKKSKEFFFFGDWEEMVGISEGHVIWLIPKYKFVFDAEKLKKLGVKELLSVKNMFSLEHDLLNDGIMSGDIRRLPDGKEAVKIEGKEGHVWVNRAYLNEFDKDITFKITKSNAPVYVFEKGNLSGLILPIKMNE